MDIQEAIVELKKSDSKLAEIIERCGEFNIELDADYFHSLARSIVFQQLSGKAAGTIFSRLEEYLDFKLSPVKCFAISPQQYRTFGISRQKSSYLIDLSKHFLEDPKGYTNLEDFTDEEIIEKLTKIKGIGKWTAQMFLMFTLLRLDVFPVDDLGIKNAMIKAYGIPEKPKKTEMKEIAEKWTPFRTIGSWYMWRSMD